MGKYFDTKLIDAEDNSKISTYWVVRNEGLSGWSLVHSNKYNNITSLIFQKEYEIGKEMISVLKNIVKFLKTSDISEEYFMSMINLNYIIFNEGSLYNLVQSFQSELDPYIKMNKQGLLYMTGDIKESHLVLKDKYLSKFEEYLK